MPKKKGVNSIPLLVFFFLVDILRVVKEQLKRWVGLRNQSGLRVMAIPLRQRGHATVESNKSIGIPAAIPEQMGGKENRGYATGVDPPSTGIPVAI